MRAIMFKTISLVFGSTAIFLGLMVAAGSAGDCDGACMDQANTLSEMILIAATGIALIFSGAFFVAVGMKR